MRQTLLTACPLDCPDSCSLQVEVEDGRLVAVDAAPIAVAANAFTQGFICKKVKHHAARVHGPDRVMTPLVRTGPKGTASFRPATWDEALVLVADRMRACIAGPDGAAGIVPYLYNSSAGLVAAASIGPELFDHLGASVVPHTICAATSGHAVRSIIGTMVPSDPQDIAHSDAVVVWGANPSVSNTHLLPLINMAKRTNGARIVVVDPRATAMARRADVHLAVRPGTDAVLAMAMTAELHRRGALDDEFIRAHTTGWEEFIAACLAVTVARAADVCGLSEVEIVDAVEILASARRPFVRLGWGMERNHNGGAAICSVLGLRLALGRFGAPGSGFVLSTGAAMPWNDRAFRTVARERVVARRVVNQNLLGPMLCEPSLSPAIRVLFVQGANPALMNPDQGAVLRGLAREDVFTVVHDQVMTDTARWADVVLPATTHFEAGDAAGSYGSLVVQPFRAVIDPVGESRTNAEVIADLAMRLCVELGPSDPASLLARGLGSADDAPTVLRPSRPFVDVFPTFPDRRARFPVPVYEALPPDPHPLTLLSPASPRTINSIFGEGAHEPVMSMHTVDASLRGIVDGGRVRVFNALGSVEVRVRVTDDGATRPGVVVLPKGEWSRNYGDSGFTVNVLAPSSVEPTVGGACFNDARVEVVAV